MEAERSTFIVLDERGITESTLVLAGRGNSGSAARWYICLSIITSESAAGWYLELVSFNVPHFSLNNTMIKIVLQS